MEFVGLDGDFITYIKWVYLKAINSAHEIPSKYFPGFCIEFDNIAVFYMYVF